MKKEDAIVSGMPKKLKPVKGWAVVVARTLGSVYRPVDWFNCYSIFPTKSAAEYWQKNKTSAFPHNRIIPVLITPILPKKVSKNTIKFIDNAPIHGGGLKLKLREKAIIKFSKKSGKFRKLPTNTKRK